MRHFFALLVFLLSSLLLAPIAQAAPTGCDGPPELCQEVKDLTVKLQAEKDAKAAVTKDEGKKVAVAVAQDDKKKSDRTARLIALAGSLAVGLKIFLTVLDNWKGYFTSLRGKAVLKLITVAVGFLAFLATNIGFGIPWYQALILAAGGPGAILVHDLTEVVPELTGVKQKQQDAHIEAKVAEKVAAVVAASVPPPKSG